jgi:DNA-binding LacI/PurR family transcriptional regulator
MKFNDSWVIKLSHKSEWNDFIAGYESVTKFVEIKNRPEAVFVYKDMAALGFQEGLLQHGFKIPDDVAVIGFDDIERAQYASIPLTTIRQPINEIGHNTVEMLSNLIEGNNQSKRILLKPELVVRASCKNNL